MLWTRLAHDVLAEIGAANDVIEVGFEIADSPDFRNIVRRGAIATVPGLGHCAHADIRGLAADTEYCYRWQVGNATSPVGQSRLPLPGQPTIRSFALPSLPASSTSMASLPLISTWLRKKWT